MEGVNITTVPCAPGALGMDCTKRMLFMRNTRAMEEQKGPS